MTMIHVHPEMEEAPLNYVAQALYECEILQYRTFALTWMLDRVKEVEQVQIDLHCNHPKPCHYDAEWFDQFDTELDLAGSKCFHVGTGSSGKWRLYDSMKLIGEWNEIYSVPKLMMNYSAIKTAH